MYKPRADRRRDFGETQRLPPPYMWKDISAANSATLETEVSTEPAHGLQPGSRAFRSHCLHTTKCRIRVRAWNCKSCLGLVGCLLIACFPTSTLVTSFFPQSLSLVEGTRHPRRSHTMLHSRRRYALLPLRYTMRLSGGSSNKHPLSPRTEPDSKRAFVPQSPQSPQSPIAMSAKKSGADEENGKWSVAAAGELEVLSTRESVLKRPDMWIGDVTNVNKSAWQVVRRAPGAAGEEQDGMEDDDSGGLESDDAAKTGGLAKDVAKILAEGTEDDRADKGTWELRAVQKEMRYNAGVLKTFDEIIVNSVDRQVEVADMREIRVEINASTGELCVWNDGPGIEPIPHKSGKGLVPEVAFGEFMASTNFDDQTRKRFTGGRFGVGAKATNAWSNWFRVRTLHASSGLEYEQTWSENMLKKTKAKVVKKGKSKKGWTEIRWMPDYHRFGMEGLDEDTRACMEMRVYDLCACTKDAIKVSLNGKVLPFQSLAQYASLFWGSPATGGRESISFLLSEKGTPARLEVMLAVSSSASLEARGLVNGVQCSQGTHIDYVVNRVADGLTQRAIKQMKRDKIKHDESRAGLNKMKTYFRQHMAVILVALLPNPRFDGQTKEKLTLHPKEWGFAAAIDDKLIERIDKKLGLVDKVLLEAEARTMASLTKKGGGAAAGSSARVSIAKYQGANLAGKANRPPCYLLATEGDSAKDLAVAGMEIVGRDRYGVIPLRGVIRNVRPVKVNAKVLKDFLKNAELAAINKVLGLQFGVEYTADNVGKLLRYDHFVIFCDQDPDGAHIAGELINYFTIMFPSLLRAKPDFLMRLGTPIIRLKPKAKNEDALSFFTTAAFRTWVGDSGLTNAQLNKRYRMKYLKGLASSNEDDAHYYFQNLDLHLVPIVYSDETDDEVVDKWFRKNRADDRKVLLSRPYDPDVCVDYSSSQVSFPMYFNQEYIHFPHYAIYRTIPNVMDGLKPSQRKVLYTAFKRRFVEPVKVVQFSGAVLETAAYHHGDTALQGAIIAMARRYCGSNNVNILQPDGQFGSRHSNHAGAARYISAGLERVTRHIFRAEDDAILDYMHEDGQQIEPKFFLPVVPMALINGCEAGIAVGWSSFVPMYNPTEVVDWLRRRMKLSEEEPAEMSAVGQPIPGVIDASLSGQQNRAKAAGLVEVDPELTETAGEEQTEDTAGGGGGGGGGGGMEGEESSVAEGEDSVAQSAGGGGRRRRDADGDGFVDGLVPWYDGFSGEVVRKGPHSFKLRGFAEYFEPERKGGTGIVSITEVGPTIRSDALREVWKERFGPAEVKDAKRKKASEAHQFLKDEQVYNTAIKVHIELTVDPVKLRACAGVTAPSKPITPDRLEKVLGISETVSTTNMHLFDASNTMRRFATPEAMLECFFRHRLEAYHRRKQHQVAEMTEKVRELSNKARYCTMVHDGELSIVKKTVAQRILDLESANFDKVFPKVNKDAAAAQADDDAGEEGGGAPKPQEPEGGGFQYLLRVSTLSCTTEHAEKLRREAAGLQGQLEALQGTAPVDMWRADLDDLEEALQDFAARKLAALDKGVKTKAPKRKTLKQRNSEKRAARKAEREQEDAASLAADRDLKAAQLAARESRVAKRRPTSPSKSPAKAKAKAKAASPAKAKRASPKKAAAPSAKAKAMAASPKKASKASKPVPKTELGGLYSAALGQSGGGDNLLEGYQTSSDLDD